MEWAELGNRTNQTLLCLSEVVFEVLIVLYNRHQDYLYKIIALIKHAKTLKRCQ